MLCALKWELYKLFIKNRAFLWVAVFVAVHMLGQLTAADVPKSAVLQSQISRYYEEYGGELTPSAEREIIKKKGGIDEAKRLMDELYADYDVGLISGGAFDEKISEIMPLLGERQAFESFYARYKYCAADPEHRYLIDADGWSALLRPKEPDFILMLFMVLLTELMFAADIKNDVNSLIKPTSRGKRGLFGARLCTVLLLAPLLGLSAQAADCLIVLRRFPLSYGCAPIQSLPYYEGCPYAFSLIGAFVCGSIIRIFGLMYCGLIAACITELSQNTVLSGLLAVSASVLPFTVGGADKAYLNWPLPTCFVQAYSYLWGGNGDARLETMAKNACASALIMIFLCAISYMHYKGARKNTGLKYLRLSALTAFFVVLTGCGADAAALGTVRMTYNESAFSNIIEAEDYYIYDLYAGDGIKVVEKKTGEQYPLFNDPLEDRELLSSVSGLNAAGNTVFFVCPNADGQKTVQSIDLDSGVRRTLFLDKSRRGDVKIFDITVMQGNGHAAYLPDEMVDFFIADGGLVIVRREALTIVRNGIETRLYDGDFEDVVSNGEAIFFKDAKRRLCRLDLKTGEVEALGDIRPKEQALIGSRLFYTDPSRGGALFLLDVDVDTGEKRTVFDGAVDTFKANENYLLVRDDEGRAFVSAVDSLDFREVEIPAGVVDIEILKDGGIVFIRYSSDGSAEYERPEA